MRCMKSEVNIDGICSEFLPLSVPKVCKVYGVGAPKRIGVVEIMKRAICQNIIYKPAICLADNMDLGILRFRIQ